jgi:hypothetical protein
MALVDPARGEQAAEAVQRAYAARHPDLADEASVLLCRSDDGARFVDE